MNKLVIAKGFCADCKKPLEVRINPRYISKRGRITKGIYCKECRLVRDKQRSGRTSEALDEIHIAKMAEQNIVKQLSKLEIARLAKDIIAPKLKRRKSDGLRNLRRLEKTQQSKKEIKQRAVH